MKLKIRTGALIVGAIIILLLAASPRVRKLLPGMDGGKGTSERDFRIPVSALVLKPEVLTNKVLATGTVLANEEVDLRSEASGKIEKIFFVEGSRVRKGDLLLKINDSELRVEPCSRRGRSIRTRHGISLAAADEGNKPQCPIGLAIVYPTFLIGG